MMYYIEQFVRNSIIGAIYTNPIITKLLRIFHNTKCCTANVIHISITTLELQLLYLYAKYGNNLFLNSPLKLPLKTSSCHHLQA